MLCLVIACCSCASMQAAAPSRPEPRLVPISDAECRTVVRENAPPSSLQQAITQSVEYLQRLPPQRSFAALDRRVTVSELLDVANGLGALLGACDQIGRPVHDGQPPVDVAATNPVLSPVEGGSGPAARTPGAALSRGDDLAHDVCERFQLYRAELPDRLLITGYYQPELPASRVPTERFQYPLYRTPDDLIDVDLDEFAPDCGTGVVQGRVQDGKLVPYYSRAEIDAGALAGRGDEIAWLDDPVEAFFLHVQGSAQLRFPDGVYMNVSYSSSNGRPYTSIGRVLIEQGKMAAETVSLSSLKDYLRSHPEEQPALLAANRRYIFFRVVATGPIGRLEVPLTAGRSIAADARVYPPAAVVFLRVATPATSTPGATPGTYSRFTVIQDAGAAITGANRIDVFWGSGSTAESIAGDRRDPGELYVVLPRSPASQHRP